MKYSFTFLLIVLSVLAGYSQTFEGEIVYQNTYKSHIPSLSDQQLTDMIGSRQEYYIKKGNYKTVTNGNYAQWQLYVNSDNKLYSKVINTDTLLWNDGSVNNDEVLSFTLNKNAINILGYDCDELILTCKSGIQKYYFNSKISVDSKLYKNHRYGNWSEYLSKSNALALKMVMDNAQFSFESVATEIKPMPIGDEFFQLPAGAISVKSPF
jgi:hypothetical protein